jgi:hypothetical protein
MSAYDTSRQESSGTDIEPRTRRALERVLTVTHVDGTPIADDESPTVVSVHSGNSGRERRVDVREGRCSCPDHKHRGVECYHIRRVKFALGVEPVDTATLAACDVDRNFAANAPGPAVLTSDGGVDAVAGDTSSDGAPERSRVPVTGGVLVYESRAVGKELVGVESVNDWDALADVLAARGHGRGAVYHLEELDDNRTTADLMGAH